MTTTKTECEACGNGKPVKNYLGQLWMCSECLEAYSKCRPQKVKTTMREGGSTTTETTTKYALQRFIGNGWHGIERFDSAEDGKKSLAEWKRAYPDFKIQLLKRTVIVKEEVIG